MRATLWRLFTAGSGLALVVACLFAAGCSSDKTEPEPVKPVPVKPLPTQRREQIEVRPVDSGETIRRHIFDAQGIETETQIEYANGDKGVMLLRPDGTVSRFTVNKPNGKLKFDKFAAPDGKTVIAGKQMRDDDTVIFTWDQFNLPAGSVRLTAYWWDGKRIFAEQISHADGSVEAIYTRKNGKRWGRKLADTKGEVYFIEANDPDGNLSYQRKTSAGQVDTCFYRKDGTLEYTQLMKNMPAPYGGNSLQVTEVVEYAADGKTVARRMSTAYNDYRLEVTETTTFNKDGTVTVRKLKPGYGNIVAKETIKDASGKVISEKDFKDEVLREEIEGNRLNMYTYRREPEDTWAYAEQYPQYRNDEEYP